MEPVLPPPLRRYREAGMVEWIETDGVGGLASSSILGANTRKQHGLLSVELPEHGPCVLVASLHEALVDGNQVHDLSTNAYCNAIHPTGFEALESFAVDPWPTWRFRFGELTVERQFLLVRGEHTAIVTYRILDSDRPYTMRVLPMLAFRGQNTVRRAHDWSPEMWHVTREFAECKPREDFPAVYIAHPNATVESIPLWYHEFLYERDQESNLHCIEDLFCPGHFEIALPPGVMRALVISTPSPRSVALAGHYISEERARRKNLVKPASKNHDSFWPDLIRAAEAYVYEAGEGRAGIYSGLPWIESDLSSGLIALPGLLLAAGNFDAARTYLQYAAETWQRHEDPAVFTRPNAPQPAAACDGPLWLFIAAWRYGKARGDNALVAETLFPQLSTIVSWYETHLASRNGHGGLLAVESPTTSDGSRVMFFATNALWLNARMILAELAQAAGRADARQYREKAQQTLTDMESVFWNDCSGAWSGAVSESGAFRDDYLRGSHILAAGLPFPAVKNPRPLVERIRERLATPLGLRSLDPAAPEYVGDGSDMRFLPQRWSGSVDPKWFGFYCDALARSGILLDLKTVLVPFQEELRRRGYGHISGAFHGDAPHTPCDFVGSACALAEVLRTCARDADTSNGGRDGARPPIAG